MTIVHVVLVVFIIIAGFVKANPANLQPFAPMGARGIFNGAAIVFFSYIGFDAVATSAEEVRNPRRDLPLGILGALSVVTLCYILMSLVLVMMVPLEALSTAGSFAAAFSYVGLPWALYIVALGALLGIVTGTLVGMFAVSRIIAAVARQHLLPPVLASVHGRFGTPWVATLCAGLATALIALFTDFADLLNMVSISTLFAFWIVALALMWHRCFEPSRHSPVRVALLSVQLFVMVAACIVFTICYQLLPNDYIGMVVCAAVFVVATCALASTFGRGSVPHSYAVPLFPFVPALSVALNTFLLGQLDKMAYERFGIWTAAITGIYLVYGALAAQRRSNRMPVLPGHGKTADASAFSREDGTPAAKRGGATAAPAPAGADDVQMAGMTGR